MKSNRNFYKSVKKISNIVPEYLYLADIIFFGMLSKKLLNFTFLLNNKAVRTFMSLEITFDIAKQTVGGKIPTPGQVY